MKLRLNLSILWLIEATKPTQFGKALAVTTSEDQPQRPADETPPLPAEGIRLIRSEELLAGAQEILIEHDGQTYRLRRTRSGKLILHK